MSLLILVLRIYTSIKSVKNDQKLQFNKNKVD